VAGEELPAGWTGKNWACAQLAGQARGDLLIFTDADVTWRPGALEGALAVMQHTQADMLTVWPTQHTETWAERLVVPMMMFVLLAYLPELGVRRLPFASLSAANGQMVAFRRETYRHIGGHHAVAGEIVEDVALARRTKQMGRRLVMALGNGLIIGRMYHNWPEARDGFAKNILAGHGGSPLALLASGVFHTGLFLWPWAWLALGALRPSAGWPDMPLAMLALGILLRALTAAVSGGRVGDALLLPISNLLFWIIALRSLAWHFGRGGPLWKGRWINTPLSS
jgi:chlorobactene glucosyltransferase